MGPMFWSFACPAHAAALDATPVRLGPAFPPASPYRRIVQNYGVSPQELIAETEIRAALARGEQNSEALRDLKGKPIALDAYFATPPELRMAFSMLKGAEVVPEELEMLKEIHRLEDQAASAARREHAVRAAPEDLRALRRLRHEDAGLPAQGDGCRK